MNELRYSIKDLENFTQIKAHTIRIWEQRYGLLSPKRTETNIRYYNEDDLKKILNINLLYTSGQKISKISLLSDEEIIETSKSIILSQSSENQIVIDKLTVLILDLKGDEIREELEAIYSNSPLEMLYQNYIMPLLQRLGQLWQVNSIDIIHEHYFSSIFREFLLVKIANLKIKQEPNKTVLLFLHNTEEHEFGILLYYYILKKSGYNCHYFGQKTPIDELQKAYDQINPKIIATTFTADISEKNFRKIESILVDFSAKSQVIISGGQLNNFNFKISDSLIQLKTIDQLKSLIK
jgi:DNA-binding transcriptional MerR regulator